MPNKFKIAKSTHDRQKEIEKLSTLEVFSLDAYLISKLPASEKLIIAYEHSRPRESQANRQSIYTQARSWINSDKCRFYLEDRKKELFATEPKRKERNDCSGTENNTENTAPDAIRTKSETIAELNELATNTSDAKLKAELLIKLSDLEGWKKEKEQTDDDTIRYYLPLSCNKCELYRAARAAKEHKTSN